MSALPSLLKTLITTAALGRRHISDTREAKKALAIEQRLQRELDALTPRKSARPARK